MFILATTIGALVGVYIVVGIVFKVCGTSWKEMLTGKRS